MDRNFKNVAVHENLHHELKLEACKQGITIAELVKRLLECWRSSIRR